MPRFIARVIFMLAVIMCGTADVLGGQLAVVAVEPAMNAGNISVHAAIKVHLNMPVMRSNWLR